jgi:hypothetical protein
MKLDVPFNIPLKLIRPKVFERRLISGIPDITDDSNRNFAPFYLAKTTNSSK